MLLSQDDEILEKSRSSTLHHIKRECRGKVLMDDVGHQGGRRKERKSNQKNKEGIPLSIQRK